VAPAVATEDLRDLPSNEAKNIEFYRDLLNQFPPTPLAERHRELLSILRVLGDPARHYEQKRAAAERGLRLPSVFNQRLARERDKVIPTDVITHLRPIWKEYLGLPENSIPVVLDMMAGGGTIPLEALRYGYRVYANELNPVAAVILKATLEYPAKFGNGLTSYLFDIAQGINERVRDRLAPYFVTESSGEWWPATENEAESRFHSKQVEKVEPGGPALTRDYLWCRIIACPKCHLNIPLSTNFHVVTQKAKPEAAIAAFPDVPPVGQGNDCKFRIVRAAEWKNCHWPRLGSDSWHPRTFPTFQNGHAICPRCGTVIDESEVKKAAQALSPQGGLPNQMYAVCSQVPVKLTYRKGEVKVRYLWRFRAPNAADCSAVSAAEAELRASEGRWLSQIPPEEIPQIMEDSRLREYGMTRWRDLFTPRQLLANLTFLDEVRSAAKKARNDLSTGEAEAVVVYLAFMLDKAVSYNSMLNSWDDGRKKLRNAFPGHDFRYRAAFAEMEAARETVVWCASQIINAYTQLAGLIHGEVVSLERGDDEDADEGETIGDGEPDDDSNGGSATTETSLTNRAIHLRPEVIVPTITCNDAAALETPPPGSVHLICVDPPYYNNVQYAELSNFFYVWLKRVLGDWPGLEYLFREELAETNREAVANAVRWGEEAENDRTVWQVAFDRAFEALANTRGDNGRKLTIAERRRRAALTAGPEPLTSSQRAERFYEEKMATIFRRAKQLLHPTGRMVVMFNHKMTKAWRALGKALIEAGFEIRTSIPILTEAPQGLNIRGLDAARSTVLLLCLPRQEVGQVTGNWGRVQDRIATVARNAAQHFQNQGIAGTDLYLSALGPALGEVGRHWPITDMAGRAVDLTEALDRAYRAVGQFRLEQILTEELPDKVGRMVEGFAADSADRNTQALWLWLDTFQGDVADSDDVRKLAKSLDIEPDTFKRLRLIESESDLFYLKPPQDVDLAQISRQQSGERLARGRAAREGDVWEERKFPNFLGAAVWNAVSLLAGGDELHRGVQPLKRWLRASGYGDMPEFRGAYAVTLYLLEQAFGRRKDDDLWKTATTEARRGWDLVLRDWRG
jgi:adenine-specific DNA methylase